MSYITAEHYIYLPKMGSPEIRQHELAWETDLKKVKRFDGLPMIHRTTLFDHVRHVLPLAQFMALQVEQYGGKKVDDARLYRMAKHHDDPEVETTDIPSPIKALMSPAEKQHLKASETEAAVRLSFKYAPFGFQQRYLRDYQEVTEKKTLESQILDIADKCAGLCETIHEIRCNGDKRYLDVLDNYRNIFSKLQTYECWPIIGQHPYFELTNIPTREEAEKLPKISVEDLQNGGQMFWNKVFAEGVPQFYQTWLDFALANFDNNGVQYFSGWKGAEQELIKHIMQSRHKKLKD